MREKESVATQAATGNEIQRIIVITPEESKFLQKVFGVSNTTVWHAVKFSRHNEIHRRIRECALKRGNVQYILSPEFNTLYITNREDADGNTARYMVQGFSNGATMEANLSSGRVTIRNRRGEEVYSYSNPKVAALEHLQEIAQSL